jgi:hypothetical protein
MRNAYVGNHWIYHRHLIFYNLRCKDVSWTVSAPNAIFGNVNRLITITGIESAAFPGQSADEIDRLLHMVRSSILASAWQ